MLEIEDIQFAYGNRLILEGVSFSVNEGEIIALIGISGSGKTTLFRLITGLINPSSGQILIGGKPFPQGTQLTTYMQQEDLLLPWRSVMGNLLLFSELGKKEKKSPELVLQARSLLKRVGLDGYEESYPHELSGGMRQRVSLARALLQNRPLMLLDEPFASLDVITREQLYELLREIRSQYQKTMVMVTHDFRDAFALADRILVLSQGKITAIYSLTPEIRANASCSDRLIQEIREQLCQKTML